MFSRKLRTSSHAHLPISDHTTPQPPQLPATSREALTDVSSRSRPRKLKKKRRQQPSTSVSTSVDQPLVQTAEPRPTNFHPRSRTSSSLSGERVCPGVTPPTRPSDPEDKSQKDRDSWNSKRSRSPGSAIQAGSSNRQHRARVLGVSW